ncbi:MAG: response regulator [Phycisphaera sp.]|nr:response regulator [Phycisphaera sp.]
MKSAVAPGRVFGMCAQSLFSEAGVRLLEAVVALSRARTLEDVTQVITSTVRELTGADGVTFVLRDEDRCYYVDEDAISPLWKGNRFPLTACISGWTMLHAERVVIEDIYQDERIPHDAYRPTFVKSLAMAPIRSEAPVGAIGAYWAERHAATDEELDVIQLLADHAAVALSNVELFMALRRGEERYRAIVDDQTELIARWRGDGERTFVNDAYSRFFGQARDELIGTSVFDHIHGEDRARVRERVAQLTPDAPVSTETHRSIDAEGNVRWTEWTDRAIFDADGRAVEYQSVGRDVTSRKDLEAQLLQSQKMETVGQLAGGVAHDLNNLLMPILSYSEMLLESMDTSDARREPLEVMHQAGEAARDLTHQLLAFSRKQRLDRQAVDLHDLITGFHPILRRTVRANVRLRVALEAPHTMVNVDIGQIRQVLLNLVVNAVDAMPSGGVLDIRTSTEAFDAEDVSGHTGARPGRFVVMTVADDGEGMDARTIEHIFEPFFTTKAPGRGTGLGLSTCYGIVCQHGGFIDVASEPGRGTTFRVCLPLTEAPVEEDVSSDAETTPAARHYTVLVAEDSQVVRTLIKHVLERAGITVIAAENVTAAVELAAAHEGTIDLLLTDIVMPDSTGVDLYERLAATIPQLSVIYMSGYTSESVLKKGLIEGGANFLQKPFTPSVLVERIHRVLG